MIFVFVFGAFLTEIVVDLSKITVGGLRPSFLAVCQANMSQVDCQHGYVTMDVCTGDPYDVKIARLECFSCCCHLFVCLFQSNHMSQSTDLKYQTNQNFKAKSATGTSSERLITDGNRAKTFNYRQGKYITGQQKVSWG